MNKTKAYYYQLLAFVILLITFSSCNNSENIPFPNSELGYTQPVTVPLVFSDAKPLKWDTAKKGGITPVIQKLDIDALPAIPYDSTGFKPFAQPPEVVKFDFNNLPQKDLSLDKLSPIPLDFKTSDLGAPPTIKAGTSIMEKGKALAIFDFGQPQGLQAKLIGALLKDHNGLLWIGSSEGLFRFDGERIQTFVQGSASDAAIIGLAEDSSYNIWFIKGASIGMIDLHKGTISYSTKIGLPLRGLDKMTVDDRGNIWVFNYIDKAVSIVDPGSMTYKNLDMKAGLSDSSAFQILQDVNKKIWITTLKGGVDIIDPVAGKIKYLRKANGLISDTLRPITEDKKGQIWLGTPEGLDAVDVKKGIIKHYTNLQGFRNKFSLNLSVDKQGHIWRTTVNGIELADVENGRIRYINEADGLSGTVITAAVEDNYHRVWVSSTTGLNIIDQYGETVHPLGTTQIISLMEDAANNLWVATQNGLYIVNPQRNAMRLLNKSNGLSNDFVQSFWKKNGNMVVATNGGFNIIDLANKTILKAGKKEGLVSDSIYVAFGDDSGNTWLTGPGSGVDKIDSAKNITLHTDVAGGLNDNTIMDIKQDKDGLIWLATNHDGIDVINPLQGTVKFLNNQPGLKDTCNRMMFADMQGRMWIGTDKGVYIADTKMGTLTSITTREGLSNNTILSLLEYNGTMIAGTNNKINIITTPDTGNSSSAWKISLLNKSQGLLKETNSWSTDAVTHDGQYLWGDVGITTINQIAPSTDSVASYITGLNVMTHPRHFADNDGMTGKKRSNGDFSDDDKLKWDSVSGPYNLPVDFTLPYDKNYLQFQFAQASLGRQDTTFYVYILEGIDKNWSAVTTNPYTENYLNLPPGKYNFKVSSKGIDGKWGKAASFKFTIMPPWYQTWWAYTIFALLGIGLLRAYIVYRSRKLQKENRILEEKVTHRTAQLKQTIDDLKSTQSQLIQSEKMASLGELTAGIAHEIQNPLNFVNNFSEVNIELTDELKEELNKTSIPDAEKIAIEKIADDIRGNQEKITFHGKRADAIVKGMLQHSRSSNGQKEPTDINALADEYLRLAYHGLRAKDKSFNATMKTDFDKTVGKINVVSQDIGRVILNLITNAFYAVTEKKKQHPDNFEPTVTVMTSKIPVGEGGGVLITVKDNGNGISKKVMDKIFQPFFTTKPAGQGTGLGLSLSYDVIKAHGGDLKVETKEGEGATFTISLPV